MTEDDRIPPIHPGEILLEEFLTPLRLSQKQLAQDIGVSASCVNKIVQGKSKITANTAMRLGKYFSTSSEFWINLQTLYNRDIASIKLKEEQSKKEF